MIRYFVFVGIIVCALMLTTSLSSTDVGEAHQASAFSGVAMFSEGVNGSRELENDRVPLAHFDKAFDLREGAVAVFKDLSIMFKRLDLDPVCEEGLCRSVAVAMSKGDSSEEVVIGEGGVVSWNGYVIKVSQTAPLENKDNVPYRAVLLVSDTNE